MDGGAVDIRSLASAWRKFPLIAQSTEHFFRLFGDILEWSQLRAPNW